MQQILFYTTEEQIWLEEVVSCFVCIFFNNYSDYFTYLSSTCVEGVHFL